MIITAAISRLHVYNVNGQYADYAFTTVVDRVCIIKYNQSILSDISQIRLNKTGVQKCAKTITYTKYVYFDSFSKGQLKILS